MKKIKELEPLSSSYIQSKRDTVWYHLWMISDDEIRARALTNLNLKYMNQKAYSTIEGLANGFDWNKTPEGFEFWKDVANFQRGTAMSDLCAIQEIDDMLEKRVKKLKVYVKIDIYKWHRKYGWCQNYVGTKPSYDFEDLNSWL